MTQDAQNQLKKLACRLAGGCLPYRIALAMLFLGVAGLIAWQSLREREPVYQGKRLRLWLGEYSECYDSDKSGGPETREAQNVAEAAVQQIGTNAIPTLLNMLRKKNSFLVSKLIPVWDRYFSRIPHLPASVRFPSWYQSHAVVLNQQGFMGFEILRANARQAVPALLNIYEQNISPSSQFYVSRALTAIGPDATRTAIPSFLRCTASSNVIVRKFAVTALSQVHDEPALVVPALAKSLSDTNVNIRVMAASGLGVFGREVRQAIPLAVPVLIKALRDPDVWVRVAAAGSLSDFGPEAKGAVPALLDLLKDEDEYASRHVAEALEQIDPEPAANAGANGRSQWE
jgi:hypothetical protein